MKRIERKEMVDEVVNNLRGMNDGDIRMVLFFVRGLMASNKNGKTNT